jgi:HK97 family phage portal protein
MGRAMATMIRAASAPSALNDYWYQPVGMGSASGLRVDSNAAMKLSVVWRCMELLGGLVGTTSLGIFHNLPNGGKEDARSHPLYRTIHTRPNDYQAADVFFEQAQARLSMRGNSFSRIIPGASPGAYPVQALIPLHPDRVSVHLARNGMPVYGVRSTTDATTEWLSREKVWHVPGLTLAADGVSGLGTIEAARESLGLALAAEQFGARTFSQGIHPGATLQVQGSLSDPAQQRLRANIKAILGGYAGVNEVAILEEGAKLEHFSLTPQDAQFLLTREFQAREIARWFGVPPHMVGEINRNTSWGAGIEQMTLGFIMFTGMRWLHRWEKAIGKDLLLGDEYFAEFKLDSLLRGDTATRWNAYRIALEWGVLTINEVRRFENLNPIAGGDIPTMQINRAPLRAEEQLADIRAMVEGRDGPPSEALSLPTGKTTTEMLSLFANDQATNVVRKEVLAMGRAAKHFASDPEAWTAAVRDFYDKHGGYVVEQLHVPALVATNYCNEQREALLFGGPGAMAHWEPDRIEDLVALTIGGDDDDPAV